MASPLTIAGAGPAGLAAAINLARSGFAVEVFEKRRDAGARFHGDLQGLENWSRATDVLDDLRRFNIHPTFDYRPFKKIFHGNATRTRCLNLDKPGFYLLRRGTVPNSLDQSLKHQAIAAGVQIRFGCRIPPESADIVATGVSSTRVVAVAKGVVFSTDADDLAVGFFGDSLAPLGYSYLLVAAGIGCIATVLFRDFPRATHCFQAAKAALLDRFPVRIASERPFGGIGQFLLRPRFYERGTLFVGEAAGLQDLFWGFGIRTAIESGALAAQSLITGSSYEVLARKRFLRRHRASIVNRFLWESLRWHDYSIIMTILDRYDLRLLYPLYNGSRLHRILYPLAAWHAKRRLRPPPR